MSTTLTTILSTIVILIIFAVVIILIVRALRNLINPKYKQKRKELGAKINGTLKHISGLPINEGIDVEMFVCPDKFVFIGDNQQITITMDKVIRIDQNGVNLIVYYKNYKNEDRTDSIVLNGRKNTKFVKKVMKRFNWGYGSTTIPSEIDL